MTSDSSSADAGEGTSLAAGAGPTGLALTGLPELTRAVGAALAGGEAREGLVTCAATGAGEGEAGIGEGGLTATTVLTGGDGAA